MTGRIESYKQLDKDDLIALLLAVEGRLYDVLNDQRSQINAVFKKELGQDIENDN